MRTFLNILRLGAVRTRDFAFVALLVSLGTGAALVEPWIYSAIIDDIAGVFVNAEPLALAGRVLDDALVGLEGTWVSIARIFSLRTPATLDLEPRTLPDVVATLVAGAILMVVVRLIAELCALAGDNRSARLASDTERRFIVRAFRHVLRLPLRYFSQRASGKIAKQVDQSDEVAPLVTAVSQDLWPDIFSLVAIVVIISFVNLELAAITLVLLPLYAFVTWRMSLVLDTDLDEYYSKWEDVSATIQESIAGIKTIRSLGNESHEADKLDTTMADAYETYMRRSRLQNLYYVAQQTIIVISKASVMVLGGYKALEHQLTPGTVVLFLTYLDHLYSPVENLSALFTTLRQHLGSVRRAEKLLAEPVDPGGDRPALAPSGGEVVFDNVVFAYGERPVLNGVSFAIRPGERVALVGPSGAGKTTVSDLLTGLYQPDSGRILIDGQSLASVDPSSVRRHVRGVAVEGVLFRTSIAENIRYGRLEASDEEVMAAARQGGLGPLLERLPAGLETTIGERGVQLSSGERQRILLARAFIARPTVLILDEATANLDFRTEARVKVALERAAKGRTTIVIAHRRSMLTDVDRVLVLQEGRIVQDGTPDQLLRLDGYFRDLMQPGETAA